LAASSSRFLRGAFVSSERNSRVETSATPSTAAKKAASFTFDGLAKPLIFLTNCSEAARTSSSVTGGSKLKRGLMFLHILHVDLSWFCFVSVCPWPSGMLEGEIGEVCFAVNFSFRDGPENQKDKQELHWSSHS
jgi:hypothetical protein